jgi:hypothetical protein
MREKLVKIFSALGAANENLTTANRRTLANTLGLSVPVIMVANPAKAEAQADAVLAAVAAVSEDNKQEIILKVPQLAFLFETPAATASPAARAPRARKTEEQAPATPSVTAPTGTVSEGIDLRIQQIELRLQRIEEAVGASHQRQVDQLQNMHALASMLHYAAQLNGHTEHTTLAGYANECGAPLAPLTGG